MTISVEVQPGAALSARRGSIGDRRRTMSLLKRAVRAALGDQGIAAASVSVTLLDDAEIAAMNSEFLSHDGPTDVISFALYDEGEEVVGDVYVGYEQAQRQAGANGVPLEEELARLVVHGTLHVLGHEHPDGAARSASPMWKAQERIVAGVMRS